MAAQVLGLKGKLALCVRGQPRSSTVTMSCFVPQPATRRVPRVPDRTKRPRKVSVYTRPNETPEQKRERRERESVEVLTHTIDVNNYDEFQAQLQAAGEKLVALEVQSEVLCQTGLMEEAEDQWKVDQEVLMQPCNQIKHVFQRTARSCPDVVFVTCEGDTEGGKDLCEKLGIDVMPTLQFWRYGRKLWEHKGAVKMEENVGDGVLFYGDIGAGGVNATDYVFEVLDRSDFDAFVTNQQRDVLAVVYVGISAAAPCLHVYPAVVALAKNFVGLANFCRVIGDTSPDMQRLMTDLNIMEVPTFIFYRNGQEVGRHVGSSRGDLIGQILLQQSRAGQPVPEVSPRRR